MKLVTLLVCISGLSFAQDEQAEMERQLVLSNQLYREATQLIENSEYRKAVPVCLELINVNRELTERWSSFSNNYSLRIMGYPLLARAYMELNQLSDAMEAYRQLVFWDIHRNDFYGGHGVVIEGLLSYSALLAERNRKDDSKSVYYAALRHYESSLEHIPFRVVFDPDLEGDSWEYSERRIKAATTMLYAMMLSYRNPECAEKARMASELWPEWNYPYLFLAQYEKDEGLRGSLFDKALALSRSEEERQMIRQVAGRLAEGTVEVPLGKDVRKKMKVLEDWRKKAERDRGSYASG